MGWFDDIQARVNQSVNEIKTDVNSYLKNRVVDQVVKVAQEQGGNRSALDLEQGKFGQPPQASQAQASVQSIQNAESASQIAGFAGMSFATIGLIGVIGYFLLSKKSRG